MKSLSATLLPLAAVALLLPASAAAQGKNCSLLGTWNKGSGHGYNDIWGYTAPDGKEYALVGLTTGFSVVDCSNPAKPVEVAYWAGKSSSWRDVKTYGQYAYVVTEASSEGVWIINLKDPQKPVFVTKWGTAVYRNCHNIAMDWENGHAYLCGTNKGMLVIDLSKNPENPTLIATYASPYVHDAAIQHGWAHLADIYGNNYRLVDVTKLPTFTQLGQAPAPGSQYCHNTWPTWDDNYCVTTNEAAGGPVAIFDITTPTKPTLIAKVTAGPSNAIAHNVIVVDRMIHASYYTEGYQCWDMSDPKNPVSVASYDTWPGTSGGYNGNWGVYSFNPSGNIFLNDISTGLYVVKPASTSTYYGKDSPGTGGVAPEVHTFGAPFLGNANFRFDLRHGLASSVGVLLFTTKAAQATVSGLEINVDLTSAGSLVLPVPTDAKGEAPVPIPLPNDSGLKGLSLFLQWLVVDKNGPLGLSSSRGMQATLFQK
ncbi:MAG: choice-of-anchor B family protein [Planctomycetota bacterium]